MMTGVASAAGWATVAVGVLHLAVATSAYDHFDLDALWFVGSGFLVILIGAVTLAARRTPLRALAVGANLAGLTLAVAFGVLTRWNQPQGPLLAALFLAGLAGSTVSPARPNPVRAT